MAHEIKLEIYIFRIREKRQKMYFVLDSFFEKNDFFKFFQNYINSFTKRIEVNEDQKKSLQFNTNNLKVDSTNRIISGVIESGEYGQESKIINRKTGIQRYKKQIDDLDVKPFYFLINAPAGSDKGIIILQRTGLFGINGIFTNHFNTFFQSRFGNLMTDFSSFVSKDLAKKFIEDGAIRELSLRRYNLPTDVAEKLGLINHSEDVLSIELKIVAKAKKSLPYNNRVKRFIESPNAVLFDVKELNSLGFDSTSTASVRSKLGKSQRTIDLSETGQLRPYYDIDSDVEKLSSGHPKFESIDNIAKSFLADLTQEFYS